MKLAGIAALVLAAGPFAVGAPISSDQLECHATPDIKPAYADFIVQFLPTQNNGLIDASISQFDAEFMRADDALSHYNRVPAEGKIGALDFRNYLRSGTLASTLKLFGNKDFGSLKIDVKAAEDGVAGTACLAGFKDALENKCFPISCF